MVIIVVANNDSGIEFLFLREQRGKKRKKTKAKKNVFSLSVYCPPLSQDEDGSYSCICWYYYSCCCCYYYDDYYYYRISPSRQGEGEGREGSEAIYLFIYWIIVRYRVGWLVARRR